MFGVLVNIELQKLAVAIPDLPKVPKLSFQPPQKTIPASSIANYTMPDLSNIPDLRGIDLNKDLSKIKLAQVQPPRKIEIPQNIGNNYQAWR